MILSCENVAKSFGETEVLRGVSLDLREREFLSLLGPSGCGKTTLLRIIAGLESLNGGEVHLNGKMVSSSGKIVPPQQREIGLVFQDVALFPHITVSENIAFGLNRGAKKNQRRIDELLELIGLSQYGNSYPHEISGGQQQRVALARALAPNPKLIMLDEPFSSLDAQLRTQVRDELHRVLTNAGVSTILVTHDQSEAFGFSDRILLFQNGRIVQKGTPQEIYQNPSSPWVAGFVGESNFLSGNDLNMLLNDFGEASHLSMDEEILVRPESFSVKPADISKYNAVIETIKFSGNHVNLIVRLKDSNKSVRVMVEPEHNWKSGQTIDLKVLRYKTFEATSNVREVSD